MALVGVISILHKARGTFLRLNPLKWQNAEISHQTNYTAVSQTVLTVLTVLTVNQNAALVVCRFVWVGWLPTAKSGTNNR